MNKKSRVNIIKMLILAAGICVFLGTTVIASADNVATAVGRDLVGRGTAIRSGVATPSGSGGTTTSEAGGTTSGSSQADTKQVDAANTGMIDQLYPFITMLALNFVLFALFVHLRLNQSRYGRSQAYYKEIDDFHWRMKHLND